MITDTALATNITPKIGMKSSRPENTATLATKLPSASDPVSPMKIFAGKQLKTKKLKSAPIVTTHTTEMFLISAFKSAFGAIMPVSKNTSISTTKLAI